MARWTGTWLGGAVATGVDGPAPGAQLGLPPDGPGSAASSGRRAAAFAIDCVLSGLVARLFFPVRDLQTASPSLSVAPLAVLALVYVLGLSLTGQTPGMRLRGLRVVPTADGLLRGSRPAVALGLGRAVVRTLLLLLLVPALISDRDGRGLHDRASGAVVVRA